MAISPSDYHYGKLIEFFNHKKTEEEYLAEVIHGEDVYPPTLEDLATHSLKELQDRYLKMVGNYADNNIHFITTHDFIKDNYKKKLLFYSMNHPTKHVIQFICLEICKILKQFLKLNTSHENMESHLNMEIDGLSNTRCLLYDCIQQVVDFNVKDCIPLTNHLSTTKDIVHLYFDTYSTLFQNQNIP